MHASTAPGRAPTLPDVPLARPGPITDDMLGQMISEARAAELSASYDVTGLYVRLILLPVLQELLARRAAMALARLPAVNVTALTRPDGGAA